MRALKVNVDIRIALHLMTAKGLAALQAFEGSALRPYLSHIVVARDNNTVNDYYDEIVSLAGSMGLAVYERSQSLPRVTHVLAVSWRWLIAPAPGQTIVVFHDSLLPRYRGFAPLVSALINGDRQIGVTALLASEEYDRGAILAQEAVEIDYPLRISSAIEKLMPVYASLVINVAAQMVAGEVVEVVQDERCATYSLWRDEYDYFIDWAWDASRIERFVHALGFPYQGAATVLDGEIYRISDCVALPDLNIENRTCGKVIFVQDGVPTIVCGQGLIKVLAMNEDSTGRSALPLRRFRSRFTQPLSRMS